MTKFQVGTILTCLTMDGQMHMIGKAIRPLFADPVTYYKNNTLQKQCISYYIITKVMRYYERPYLI